MDFEIDIATGASGSEVVVGTIKGKVQNIFSGSGATASVGVMMVSKFYPFYTLVNYASGTRLTARVRTSGTSALTFKVSLAVAE